MALVVAGVLISSQSKALEADYTSFKINGKEYDVPIPNKTTREDFRYLKMALAGDKIAREMLMGNSSEKFIYIGDEHTTRWVRLTSGKEEVIEYSLKGV